MASKVLVLGAGFGGLNAALQLDNLGFEVELVDRNSYHEYTPGLYSLYRDKLPEEKLRINLNEVIEGTGVEFSREAVVGINPDRKTVDTNAGTHEYEYLVLALGGEPGEEGLDLSDVESPYTLEGAKKIKRMLPEEGAVTIVGAGHLGFELAAELDLKGYDVTVVEEATGPLPEANEKASHIALDYMNKRGIDFKGGQEVAEVEEDCVKFEDGRTHSSDIVIWAGGLQASQVVQEAFDADAEGLEVDNTLQYVDDSDIFALGDCADTDSIKTSHIAMNQSGIVAKNLAKPRDRRMDYEYGSYPMLVSAGKRAILVYGRTAFMNRTLRHFKNWVRRFYWFRLKWRSFL